ncbi:MAG TPA: hypothetical protein PKW14_11775 [Bacteroidota bacterium]|nr:hypothetical protein [Bacteroidota bacterium]
MKKINIAKLGNWLNSWVGANGEIRGFHNHSVWGDNPYRYGDFTSGHTTFASPFIPALSYGYLKKQDNRVLELIKKLIKFQTNSFQENGFFAHIGFQVGEKLKHGLIHNVVPDVALSESALILKDILDEDTLKEIDLALRKNFDGTNKVYFEGPTTNLNGLTQSCCNQDYCRLWARLLHMKAFNHNDWDELVYNGLNFMIEYFHINGIPENDCSATSRIISDKNFLEPAEYYGLMINPLILGYERYNEKRFLEEALKLANHIIKSSWVDKNNCKRFHRNYIKRQGKYVCVKEPMLIGGMGITLSSIYRLNNILKKEEINEYLNDIDRTYSFYQSESGFFLAGTGWYKECDIIPSTAWQSHDFYYLMNKYDVDDNFWNEFFTDDEKFSVVLGINCYWIENKKHWALKGYYAQWDANIIGRKDEDVFYYDIPEWIEGKSSYPESYKIIDEPKFYRSDYDYHYFTGSDNFILSKLPELNYCGKLEI